eukprot:797548-Rhodomonas_salina.1
MSGTEVGYHAMQVPVLRSGILLRSRYNEPEKRRSRARRKTCHCGPIARCHREEEEEGSRRGEERRRREEGKKRGKEGEEEDERRRKRR